MKNVDKVHLDINHQDPAAKVLEKFDLFSFLSPTTAPREMKEYWYTQIYLSNIQRAALGNVSVRK